MKKHSWKKVADIKKPNKSGKNVKHGVVVQNEQGYRKTLLNPFGKSSKYFNENQTGVAVTNDGSVKRDKDGYCIPITKAQRAYRAGYIQAVSDNTKIYKAKQSKISKKQ